MFKGTSVDSGGMDEVAGIYARQSPYLDRYVQIGVAQGRVISVSFPEAAEDAEGDHDLLDRIEDYLRGTEDDFADVSVALTLPTDKRRVLDRVRELPYGEDVDVAQLVGLVGGLDSENEDDLALAREALAENPVPILIPDHRVRDGPSTLPAAVEQKIRSLEGI